MDEYISKQKVLDYLNGYLHSLGDGGADTLFNRGQRRALINSIQDISAVKAADIQPVKRGRWENEYLDGDVWWADCNNCKNETHSRFGRVSSYAFCPNCGARMDWKEGAKND